MTSFHNISTARFGFWASLGTAVTTLLTFVVAILTPPLSGPLCTSGCFRYPYLDIATRFPRDYYWMFPAVVAILLYLAFMVALSGRSRGSLMAELGRWVAVMGGLVLLGTYYVQLAVVQPSLLAGETDGIALLSQYNPHGVFIALEELGYLLVSLSLACMVPGLLSASRPERFVRRLFLGGLALNLVAFAFFLFQYGHRREYLFELAAISIDWLVVIAGAFTMAIVFRREMAAARRTSRTSERDATRTPVLASNQRGAISPSR